MHDRLYQLFRQCRIPRNAGVIDAQPFFIFNRAFIGLSHTHANGRHVIHEKIGKMFRRDHDQCIGFTVFDRLAHAFEIGEEFVAHYRIGAFGTTGYARTVAADTCKN